MDKAFWQAISADEYAVPGGYTASGLLPDLQALLGDTDPELRDDVGYSVFARWLLAGHFSTTDLRGLLPALQHNLTVGLGEQGTDSVFLRAFSVLWLAAITYYHNQKQPFLTESEIHTLLDAVLDYLHAERDLRGYVPGQGWAHSAAHTADLLDELAQCQSLSAEDASRVLAGIADKALAPTGVVFQHSEDERLAVAVISAFGRDDCSPEQVSAWLAHFAAWIAAHPRSSTVTDGGLHSAYLNARDLLRSVFVRLHGAEGLPDRVRGYATPVLETLKAFSLRM